MQNCGNVHGSGIDRFSLRGESDEGRESKVAKVTSVPFASWKRWPSEVCIAMQTIREMWDVPVIFKNIERQPVSSLDSHQCIACLRDRELV